MDYLQRRQYFITEYAEETRKNGEDIKSVAIPASKHRLRPIIMTSVTMILGLMPMIFASGAGSNVSRSHRPFTSGYPSAENNLF